MNQKSLVLWFALICGSWGYKYYEAWMSTNFFSFTNHFVVNVLWKGRYLDASPVYFSHLFTLHEGRMDWGRHLNAPSVSFCHSSVAVECGGGLGRHLNAFPVHFYYPATAIQCGRSAISYTDGLRAAEFVEKFYGRQSLFQRLQNSMDQSVTHNSINLHCGKQLLVLLGFKQRNLDNPLVLITVV